MRWWMRLVITLVLAPLLWWLGVAYLLTQQGAAWSDVFAQIVPVLESVYIVFTLPALVVCGVALTASDMILSRLGIALLTVVVSPLLAGFIAAAVRHLVYEPHVQSATGAVPLAIIYGLIWGLTIREPRNRRPVPRRTADGKALPTVAADA